MAGTYPDAPGPRIAYDRDGTAVFTGVTSTGVITPMSATNIANLNDDSVSTTIPSISSGSFVLFMFPQPTDVTHWVRSSGGSTPTTEVSSNTTNGIDGTWVAVTSSASATTNTELRTGYVAVTAPGATAFRIKVSGIVAFNAIHLYGKPSASSDRLEFWHPTLDQPLSQTPAHFDYGDHVRGSGAVTKDFRIKNLSTTLTANSITVGCEALTDASPTFVSQMQFRYNGGSFAGTASLGNLGPNSISQPFTAQLTTSTSTALGMWQQRYYANVGNWS